MVENKSSYVRTRIAHEMEQDVAALADRLGSASGTVFKFMIHSIIVAVMERLACEYYLEPRFWEYLSEKESITNYLYEEVKKLGYEISDSALADTLMDAVYANIDQIQQN